MDIILDAASYEAGEEGWALCSVYLDEEGFNELIKLDQLIKENHLYMLESRGAELVGQFHQSESGEPEEAQLQVTMKGFVQWHADMLDGTEFRANIDLDTLKRRWLENIAHGPNRVLILCDSFIESKSTTATDVHWTDTLPASLRTWLQPKVKAQDLADRAARFQAPTAPKSQKTL